MNGSRPFLRNATILSVAAALAASMCVLASCSQDDAIEEAEAVEAESIVMEVNDVPFDESMVEAEDDTESEEDDQLLLAAASDEEESSESNASANSSDDSASLQESPSVESSSANETPAASAEPESASSSVNVVYIDSSKFKKDGVWYDSRYRYTYYSSRVLYHYKTAEWTAGQDGVYRDSDGYVVVSSSDLSYGSTIKDTPFGDCKVYDSGCASGTIDVYVNW